VWLQKKKLHQGGRKQAMGVVQGVGEGRDFMHKSVTTPEHGGGLEEVQNTSKVLDCWET